MTDQEISLLVAEKVMGWQHLVDGSYSDEPYYFIDAIHEPRYIEVAKWQPTTRIDQAWQVVEKMVADGWGISIHDDWLVVFFRHDKDAQEAVDKSAARAVCIAALRAVGQEVDGGTP